MTIWLSYILAHPAALLALIAKITGVTLWSSVLARRVPDRLTSWLHAWLGVQAAQIAIILCLSAFSALSRTSISIWFAMLFASGAVAYVLIGRRFERPSVSQVALFSFLAVPFLIWIVRCMVLPDFSSDGQAYGTARISIWMNYRTVFVHMPTIMLNIFADEWNGELNALTYAFAAGNLQGEMMGNAEILILSALASAWAAQRFGATRSASIVVGILMGTTPAFVGLAGLTKGDLLACVGVVMAVGMLAEGLTIPAVLLSMVWFAVAGGAKISVLLGAMIIGAYALWSVRRQIDRRALMWAAPALALTLIFMSRFVANAFIYHHPFVRVHGEGVDGSIMTLVRNIALIGDRFIGFFPIFPDGHMYPTSVAGGLGLAGWIAVLGLLFGFYRPLRRHAILAALCVISIIASAYLIPSYLWNFRYFLPFVSVLAIMMLVPVCELITSTKVRFIAIPVAIACAYFNFGATFAPGDISTPGGLEHVLTIAGKPYAQMEMTLFSGIIPEIDPAFFDAPPKKTIVVFNELGSLISPLAGSFAQNRLYLVDSKEKFVDEVQKRRPDVAVLAGLPASLPKPFELNGFVWKATGQYFNIAVRKENP